MSTSEDVMRLYSRFGGDPGTYQEVVMERQVGLAVGKWAMLGQVDLSAVHEVPLVQRHLHPAPVQRSVMAAVEQVRAPETVTILQVAAPAALQVAPMAIATPAPEPAPQVAPIAETDAVIEQPAPPDLPIVVPPLAAVVPPVSDEQLSAQRPLVAESLQPASSRMVDIAPIPVSPATKDFGQQSEVAMTQRPATRVPSFAPMGTRPTAPVVPKAAFAGEHVAVSDRAAPPPSQLSGATDPTKLASVAPAPAPVPAPKRTRPRPAPAAVAPVAHEEPTLAGVFNRLASQTNSHPSKKGVLRKRFDT